VPGRVKTRLLPRLSAEQAADLHESFVRDALELLLALTAEADIELHTDRSTDSWVDLPVARLLQDPGDLGRRMLHAITTGLDAGRGSVMIVGSDSPTLPVSHLRRLLESHADVALGPAEDGGYYAIGCRRAHPQMFGGVQFSGPETLRETADAVRACDLSVELGEPWIDVDTPEDMERLARFPALPRHTAECLSRLGFTR